MKLGAHMSIAGSVTNALRRGESVGCETVQIFTKNNNRWQGKTLSKEDIVAFQEDRNRTSIEPIFAHNCYLINLASPDPVLFEKSITAMIDEVHRCDILALPYLVMHPGAHKGTGTAAGITRIAGGLDDILEATRESSVELLLETTAGQGTSLGHTFSQLRDIIKRVSFPHRLGICLDSCHIFAAGYDIRTREGYESTIDEFQRLLGLEKLRAIHLNDSKRDLGTRVDRHEHIGKGFLGLDPFRFLLNDPRLVHLPAVLETPKNKDCDEDRVNLAVLRGLINVD